MSDGGVITRPRLLYYTKGMLIAVFSNVYTLIDLMNGARYMSIEIVLNDDAGIFNLQLVDNQVNNHNNLISTRCKYNFVQLSSKSCITTLIYFLQTCFSQV